MDRDQELKSLKRGLKALALLNDYERLTISELSRRLGLPRTTAERVIMTLLAEGYVERDRVGKAFQLAPKVCALSRGFSDETWITHVATPLLFQTTARIGWPLAIATPHGEKMMVRVTTDPATSLNLFHRHVGTEIPMMRASSGFVFLAYAPEQQREHMLSVIKASADPRQRMAHDERYIATLLANTRKQGCAFSPEEGAEAASEGSISVPVFVDGAIKAVLLMMYIRSAMTKKALLSDYLPQLRQLAEEIAHRVSTEGALGGRATDIVSENLAAPATKG